MQAGNRPAYQNHNKQHHRMSAPMQQGPPRGGKGGAPGYGYPNGGPPINAGIEAQMAAATIDASPTPTPAKKSMGLMIIDPSDGKVPRGAFPPAL